MASQKHSSEGPLLPDYLKLGKRERVAVGDIRPLIASARRKLTKLNTTKHKRIRNTLRKKRKGKQSSSKLRKWYQYFSDQRGILESQGGLGSGSAQIEGSGVVPGDSFDPRELQGIKKGGKIGNQFQSIFDQFGSYASLEMDSNHEGGLKAHTASKESSHSGRRRSSFDRIEEILKERNSESLPKIEESRRRRRRLLGIRAAQSAESSLIEVNEGFKNLKMEIDVFGRKRFKHLSQTSESFKMRKIYLQHPSYPSILDLIRCS